MGSQLTGTDFFVYALNYVVSGAVQWRMSRNGLYVTDYSSVSSQASLAFSIHWIRAESGTSVKATDEYIERSD